MSRRRLPSLLFLAGLLGGCAAASDGSEASASKVVESKRFAMHPGVERVAQHKALGMGTTDSAVQQMSMDRANVYWLARISLLVYRNLDDIKSGLAEMGLPNDDDHFRFFEDKATDTQAIYVTTASLSKPPQALDNPWNATSPDVAILAFRGTSLGNLSDIGRDLALWKQTDVDLGKLHRGFAYGVQSVWGELDGSGLAAFLRQHHSFDSTSTEPERLGAELYITGHSLGAGLANIALARTAVDSCRDQDKFTSFDKCFLTYTPVSGLVTFGSPRAGDRDFAVKVSNWMRDRTPIFRIVNGKDAVSKIPNIGYQHFGFGGDEKAFRVHIVPPRQMTIGEGDDQGDGDGSIVGDHNMLRYIPLLESLLQ